MAAQTRMNPDIANQYQMVRKFEDEAFPISFDVNKREWRFTAAVTVKIAGIVAKNMVREGTYAIAKQSVTWGATGAILSVAKDLWDGLLGAEVVLIKVAEKALHKAIAGVGFGAIKGGVEGAVNGVIEARAEIIYKAPHVVRNDHLSEKATKVMTALFKRVARHCKIVCPVSKKIFHLPVKTNCKRSHPREPFHAFESYVIMRAFEDNDTVDCPIEGCNNRITKQDITFHTSMRMRVSEIMKESLSWLASQDTEKSDITPEEREYILLNSADEAHLSDNVDLIVVKIQSQKLNSKDVKFLSNLVLKAIHVYNESIKKVFHKLSRALTDDIDKMDVETFGSYQQNLFQWVRNLTIKLDSPEQP